ncbi:MAG: rod shape-determining protein [Planctomycetes bacterium]|nr:rod shape-determining protein [Planctomycetota bacterium]
MIDRAFGLFSTDMGIDLGTANTLVCVRGKGIVLNEPSVVAVRAGTNQVLLNGNAVGRVAKEMIGRTPGSIESIRPLKHGVIADFDVTEALLNYFITKVHNRKRFFSPRVVIAIPSGITAVEKRAVYNSAERAGARKVYLVEEPRAAGLGIGLPIESPVANMVVDIGGGTTEIAVLSLADVVTSVSLRVAGDHMDEAIIQYMKKTYNILLGDLTAERVKIEIGSAYPLKQEMTMEVRGRDLIGGLPRSVTITSEEIREGLREPVNTIVEGVKETLEKTAPELSADLVERGMVLCGGGVLLRGIDQLLREATGLPVRVADDPMTCVARGTEVFLEKLDQYSSVLDTIDDDY